jgi:hypothetical protein
MRRRCEICGCGDAVAAASAARRGARVAAGGRRGARLRPYLGGLQQLAALQGLQVVHADAALRGRGAARSRARACVLNDTAARRG